MGEVYRARDTQLGRYVALKVLPANVLSDEVSIGRFQREARAASSLNHPHICTVYDVGEQDGTHYIAMELMEGSTLAHFLAGKPLPLEDVLNLGIQIADALAATNEKGVIHRDIKPSNIFVTSRSDAKLLDFGLAKEHLPAGADTDTLSGAMTSRGEVLGTVGYMSPEQAEGKELDARSDIFSFGAVLYEMATGRRAFPGSSTASIMAEILRSEPPPAASLNPKVPHELQRIISKALEKRPPDRYQSARELMIDLRRLKRQLLDSDASQTTHRVAPVRWRKKTAIVAGIGAMALVWLIVAGLSSGPVARILDSQQITYSTEHKEAPLVTDGTRLYFQGQDGPVEMSVNGGAIAPLRGSTGGMRMLDVSPDGSQLLAIQQNLGDESYRGEMWSIPVLGGAPKRIGSGMVTDARWMPDGRSVIYMYLHSVFTTGPDGANPKLLWEAPGDASEARFSPDGRHIRLTVEENHFLRIWELNSDGSHAHRLLGDWPTEADQFAGRWTPDGGHFIFLSNPGGTNNIYELIEPGWLAFWKKRTAAKLTSGEIEALGCHPQP